ncbi:hypothetical protein [Piscirickettsia litoralis]|uniref:Uncharacterized protein n=1 Tax=Piscirickettsia litoralis TaxID=1891921 RepID=A0ABX3A2Z3_9GAMM|nr:hypothetical protein [Piscirickettsia litoralis]ODN41750.1 hypothetical protein BGC07_00570 [Piscirickettsia litoralis]
MDKSMIKLLPVLAVAVCFSAASLSYADEAGFIDEAPAMEAQQQEHQYHSQHQKDMMNEQGAFYS